MATLALASPVYLRLFEHPGLGGLIRLIVVVQLAPALGLWLVDLTLMRSAPPAWHRLWRRALYVVAMLSFCRQAQVSLSRVGASPWASEPLVIAAALAAAIVVVSLTSRVLGLFMAAFAPALAGWTVFIVATLGWPGTPPARPVATGGRPVFVLLFDGLDPAAFMRAGRVAADWPAFHRLAGRSVVFSDATANYGTTCPSVAAMLTGRLLASVPRAVPGCLATVPGLAASNVLSDLARERRVVVYGQPLHYCFDPAFECRGTADLQARRPWLPLLQHWLPNGLRAAGGVDRMIGYSEHTYTRPLFEAFLEGVTAAGARHAVFYLHLLLPHYPYVFDADGRVHAPFYPGSAVAGEHAEMLAAYVAQARFVDRLLGRFLDRLDAQGLAEQSVIVATSDHGLPPFEAFAAPRVMGGIEVNGARPRVVLMLKAPGLAPAATAARYEHLDFRRLLSAVIHGDWTPGGEPGARERLFCDGGRWYTRGADGRWSPRADEHGCQAPES